MSCCGLDTVDGLPPSGGGAAVTATTQGAIVRGLDAANPVGTTDSTVIRFTGAGAPAQVGTVPLANWLAIDDDAALATRFRILQPGFYQALIYIPLNTGDVLNAISFNATAAQRQTANPEPFDPEIYGGTFQLSGLFNSIIPGQPVVPVRQADITGGTNVIRAHVTTVSSPGTPPGAGGFADPANVAFRLFRVGDIAA